MNKEKKVLFKTIFVISLVVNIILICYFIFGFVYKQDADSNISDDNYLQSANNEDNSEVEQSTEEVISQIDLEYDARYAYEYQHQLFFGKWEITELIPAESAQPSRVSGFYPGGVFRGVNYTEFLESGEITFSRDYIEHSGEKYEISDKYRTFAMPLLSEEVIVYNTAEVLGISGPYYAVVKFDLLDEPDQWGGGREANIRDFNTLLLKDNDTIYISINSYANIRLERIED